MAGNHLGFIEGMGEEVDEVSPPGESATGDYCSVCNKPLRYAGRGKHPTKCEEHKAGGSKSSNKGPGGSPTGGGATQGQWNRFSGIALIAITWLIGRYAAGGQGLFLKPPPHMTEEELDIETDLLSMDKSEADPIAKLIASKVTPTSFNKHWGKYVVMSLEYEEVGEALYAYGKRIAPALAHRINSKAPRVPRAPKQTPVTIPTPNVERVYASGTKEQTGWVPPAGPIDNITAQRLLRETANTNGSGRYAVDT